MIIVKQLERLKRISKLIALRATGEPKEFAERMNLSRSQLYNDIQFLKDIGAPIVYCRKSKTFLYSSDIQIIIDYNIQIIEPEEQIQINAGSRIDIKFIFRPRFLDCLLLN